MDIGIGGLRYAAAFVVTGLMAASLAVTVPASARAAGASGPDHPLRGIKGADNRVLVDPRVYPWSTVGRITKGDGSVCSATLIGPALAVTAAHCLWNRRTGDWMPARSVFLTLGWDRGQWTAASGVEHYTIAPGYAGPGDHSLANSAHDWALLHLSEPLGAQAGWLGLAPQGPEGADGRAGVADVVLQAGYSMDRKHVLSGHLGCRVTGRVSDSLLVHDCDATRGDSGSPLFAWVDGSFRLLGLHVSTFRDGGPVRGAAVAASAFGRDAGQHGSTFRGRQGAGPMDDALHGLLDSPATPSSGGPAE